MKNDNDENDDGVLHFFGFFIFIINKIFLRNKK
jgi:hypothetical protein